MLKAVHWGLKSVVCYLAFTARSKTPDEFSST